MQGQFQNQLVLRIPILTLALRFDKDSAEILGAKEKASISKNHPVFLLRLLYIIIHLLRIGTNLLILCPPPPPNLWISGMELYLSICFKHKLFLATWRNCLKITLCCLVKLSTFQITLMTIFPVILMHLSLSLDTSWAITWMYWSSLHQPHPPGLASNTWSSVSRQC